MTTSIKEARSGINSQNIQEVIDAGASAKHATLGGQQQYETPKQFAEFFNSLLAQIPHTVFDPQCASGNTMRHGLPSWCSKFGFEIDRRFAPDTISYDGVKRLIGNCVVCWEVLDELYPDLRFECQNANPPFGCLWPIPTTGIKCDSTEYTWGKIMERASETGMGWFISNHKTIERLKIHEHERVYLYQKFPAGVWKNCEVEIGVVHWDASPDRPKRKALEYHTLDLTEHLAQIEEIKDFYLGRDTERSGAAYHEINEAFNQIDIVLKEEEKRRPPFNVWLDEKDGMLRAYLSTRFQIKRKITRDEVLRIYRVNKCHPLTLTTERESRKLLAELIHAGIYTIQPAARKAIEDALAEVHRLAAPIMPTTDFESVAYADDEDHLTCIKSMPGKFTAGRKYEITTSGYSFVEKFKRQKPHYDEAENRMYTMEHECQLTGSDRYIQVQDDAGKYHRFMDRPQIENQDHDEKELWTIFAKPEVKTVSEVHPELVERNKLILSTCELLAGFTYYPGQVEYLSRVGTKDYGIIAGDVGTGKSLMAISLIQMKGPKRALIIAPQGTMRTSSTDDDDEDDEETEQQASQWVQELTRFGPGLPVFQLFSMDDYRRILSANGGTLPAGVYVSYYEAMFSNGAREKCPDSWNDERLQKEIRTQTGDKKFELGEPEEEVLNPLRYWCGQIGKEVNGIRCILQPAMASEVGHLFDMVCLDEGHKCCNLDANVSQALIRLQPKYRYVFTATPIPNVVSNLFSLMGWVCVKDWFKGELRNAAWPYARGEISRFIDTFQSEERDFTQEKLNQAAANKAVFEGKSNSRYRPSKCVKVSPIISAPARLLKILKPSMAYISKTMCRSDYKEAKIVDVRVPMGSQQVKLYVHFMNRGNIPAKHPLVRARKQITYLRNICADPAGFSHGGPHVNSNFNPKTVAGLELARDIINRGDPVVIVCARKGQTNTLHTRFRDAGVLVSRIDSTIAAEQHSHQSNLFKAGKTQVHLMGIKCAVAHSYSECPYMIILSLEYSWGSLAQARGRVDRVNSKYDRTIWCILHKHSLEELMFDVVATKSDSASICLRGERVPRAFKPVDASEILAQSIIGFKDESQDERECEAQWPKLRASFHPCAVNR